MLFVVGLGLSDERDITVKGLDAVKSCSKSRLEAFYGKEVLIADRELVETGCDSMLEQSKTENVAFLVVGDPYGATTHADLVLRAIEMGVKVSVIHNASIMNAIGCCGLQLYNYGQTISMVFFTETWRPDSFYDKIKQNSNIGLHTLCLLDIKVKEQSIENMARGRLIYEPPRYMTINQAAKQLIEVERNRGEMAYTANSIAVGLARIGSDTQQIVCGTLQELVSVDFGLPLHSLIIAGKMHFLEAETLKLYAVDADNFIKYAETIEK